MTVMSFIAIVAIAIIVFLLVYYVGLKQLYLHNVVWVLNEDVTELSNKLFNEFIDEVEIINSEINQLKAKELYGLEAMLRDDELSELTSRLTALNELNEARIAFIKTLYFKAFAYNRDYDMPVLDYIKCQLYPKHKKALINQHKLNYLNYNEL